MKYFTIVALTDDNVVEKFEICADSPTRAKRNVEDYWRKENIYDARVVKVLPSTYEAWASDIWGDQFSY